MRADNLKKDSEPFLLRVRRAGRDLEWFTEPGGQCRLRPLRNVGIHVQWMHVAYARCALESACSRGTGHGHAIAKSHQLNCNAVTDAELQKAVDTVKSAVTKPGSVPGPVLLDSVLALESQKLSVCATEPDDARPRGAHLN